MTLLPVLKNGRNYVDWYGRTATVEQYLAYHAEIGDVPLPMPQVDLKEESEEDPLPSDRLKGSGIPHIRLLKKNGIETISEIPNTFIGLKALNGIGQKSAADIANWLRDNREINLYGDAPEPARDGA